jgi:hypothetical protein
MRLGTLGAGRILALIAAIIFIIAAFGEWPDDLADDVDAVSLGLAFLAASFVVP